MCNIAILVYTNYTENVDMNNVHFSLSELTSLFVSDRDILKVEFITNDHLSDVWTRNKNNIFSLEGEALQNYKDNRIEHTN